MDKATKSLGSHKVTSMANGLQGIRVLQATLLSQHSKRLSRRAIFREHMVIQLTKPSPPPTSLESRMESMLERILESQTKLLVEFNGKFDAIETYINGKIDNLSSHMKKLDV